MSIAKFHFSQIIFIEINYFSGYLNLSQETEREIIAFLISKSWTGILLLDDILDNWTPLLSGASPKAMLSFWNSIEYEKYDLSNIGHYSGTGLVNIGDKYKIDLI